MGLVKYNNNSISAVTSAASIPSGALTLIKTLTASSSATLSFVHGTDGVVLDSTYPIYKFEFINIHPENDNTDGFEFNVSIDGGSNYNVAKTTTFVKHFIANINTYHSGDYSANSYIAGYGNTTSAINAIKFQMSSGNIDSGEILLFGVN